MRHLFGLSPADVAMQRVADQLILRPGAVGTVWDSLTGGSQLTDLTDLLNGAITTVTADGNAGVGFYGPDGVTTVYIDFGFTSRYLMQATDLGTLISSIGVTAAAALPATGGTVSGNLAVTGTLTADGVTNWINVAAHGAVGNGVTDDTTAIQAVLTAAAAGSVVYLPGSHAVSAPLTIPPQVTLRGKHGGHVDSQAAPTLVALSGFTGASVLLLVDQSTGGYARASNDQRIECLSIDCTALSGSTIDGIQAQGLVHGVYLTEVSISHPPNHGLAVVSNGSGSAYSWRGTRIRVGNAGGIGLSVGMTDSTWIDCESIAAASHGWFLPPGSNSQFIGCRAEWSGADGYNVGGSTGTGSGSGGPLMIGCTSDRNAHHGMNITSAATGNGPISISGCQFRRDGSASTSSGYAGINISSATMPVIINGVTVYPGTNDDGSGNATPQYGLSVTSASLVSFAASHLHAISAGFNDGGSNVSVIRGLGVIERTGSTSSPSTPTAGVQTTGPNGASLDVPQRALGMAHPREHSLAAWTFPPELASSGKAGVAGTLYLAQMYVPRSLTATKLGWGINTVGSGAVAGQSFVGLYNSSGTRLASVGVDARITTTGPFLETISVALTPGTYWLAILINATGMPAVYRAADISASLLTWNQSASQYRFATNGTGLTALPSTITPASNSAAQFSYMGAIG